MSLGRHVFQTCICSCIVFNSFFVLYLMRCFGNNPLYMDFIPIKILFCSVLLTNKDKINLGDSLITDNIYPFPLK